MRVDIIQSSRPSYFKEELARFIRNQDVIDIKFAVTPNIESGISSSYSCGETYYALVLYK